MVASNMRACTSDGAKLGVLQKAFGMKHKFSAAQAEELIATIDYDKARGRGIILLIPHLADPNSALRRLLPLIAPENIRHQVCEEVFKSTAGEQPQ